jgi:hypothetical protein
MEALSAEPLARILIEHPHSYRQWTILEKDAVAGFWRLQSRLRLDKEGTTTFELVLHESEFEIV